MLGGVTFFFFLYSTKRTRRSFLSVDDCPKKVGELCHHFVCIILAFIWTWLFSVWRYVFCVFLQRVHLFQCVLNPNSSNISQWPRALIYNAQLTGLASVVCPVSVWWISFQDLALHFNFELTPTAGSRIRPNVAPRGEANLFWYLLLSFQDLALYFGLKPKAGEKEVTTDYFFMLWFEFCADFKARWKRENKNISNERYQIALFIQPCCASAFAEQCRLFFFVYFLTWNWSYLFIQISS